MDARDLETLLGLFLCEFGAHLQRERKEGGDGCVSGVETENETESDLKKKKQSISDSPETTKASGITEMSDRYQGLRDLGTKNRMVEKDLEVLVDYTQQCDDRSHSVTRIIYKSRMLGRMGTG